MILYTTIPNYNATFAVSIKTILKSTKGYEYPKIL